MITNSVPNVTPVANVICPVNELKLETFLIGDFGVNVLGLVYPNNIHFLQLFFVEVHLL